MINCFAKTEEIFNSIWLKFNYNSTKVIWAIPVWSSRWKKSQKWQWRSRLSSNLRPKNWNLHDQSPPDYRQIWITKSVNFEILNFGDWSWPPFSVEVSRWPFTLVGWHWQVDLKILFVRNGPLLRRIWCTYMVSCAWCNQDKNKTKWHLYWWAGEWVNSQNCVS